MSEQATEQKKNRNGVRKRRVFLFVFLDKLSKTRALMFDVSHCRAKVAKTQLVKNVIGKKTRNECFHRAKTLFLLKYGRNF